LSSCQPGTIGPFVEWMRLMAVEHPPGPTTAPPEIGVMFRHLKYQAGLLLPGAFGLFAIQVFGLARNGSRLELAQQFGLGAGLVFTAVSVLLLGSVLARRNVESPMDPHRLLRALGWTIAGGIAALLAGAAADVFVATDVVTGSFVRGAIAGGLLIVVGLWICW
jgi:hypothetical protein